MNTPEAPPFKPPRFRVLFDNPLCVRDVKTGKNYHTGSRTDSVELAKLLNFQEDIIMKHLPVRKKR